MIETTHFKILCFHVFILISYTKLIKHPCICKTAAATPTTANNLINVGQNIMAPFDL